MDIVSSSKCLILSEFPNLQTKFTYQFSENSDSSSDFQFFNLRRFLVSVNKGRGIEILRTSDEDVGKIIRLKKIKVDNVFCASTPKKDHDEIALGLSDGEIKFFNYRNLQFYNYFPKASSKLSIVNLDYSACDDYLSSVYENGSITIYGMKTRKKIETLTFDKTCSLSKFHPIKRFHLGVITYRGAVHIYDVNAKQDIFNYREAHKSPCRDLAMCPACPEQLLTCGFDRIINIMDLRKRNSSIQIDCDCPLSSIALSECGTYFCVGNLKGEIQSYDIRNTQNFLYSKKIHDKSITRISFVPNQKINESIRQSISNNLNLLKQRPSDVDYSMKSKISLGAGSNLNNGKRDSFCDFIGFCSNQFQNDVDFNQAKINSQTQQQHQLNSNNISAGKRDSFFDLIDACSSGSQLNNNLFSLPSKKNSLDGRLSGIPTSLNLNLRTTTETISENDEFQNNDLDSNNEEENLIFVTERKKKPVEKLKNNSQNQIIINKTPITISCENSMNKETTNENFIDLVNNQSVVHQEDNIEDISMENIDEKLKQQKITNISNVLTKDIEEFPKLPDNKNSTPNINKNKNFNNNKNDILSSMNFDEFIKLQNNIHTDLKQDIKNVHDDIKQKFSDLENEIKFNAETNKWELINQIIHLYDKQTIINENIQEALFYLLKTDEFLNNYIKLKKENEELKKKLSEIQMIQHQNQLKTRKSK